MGVVAGIDVMIGVKMVVLLLLLAHFLYHNKDSEAPNYHFLRTYAPHSVGPSIAKEEEEKQHKRDWISEYCILYVHAQVVLHTKCEA